MLQEQHMEPLSFTYISLLLFVFISKKRTPRQQKLSEFQGGDLNKYTSGMYAIQNGNEIFGGAFLLLPK
ncbi:unnamed protein product [Gongylonema pulchrum]|uniref:Uncharacterized protein n=1 Tax=Gongylonema pulchrum TaxID=637853 RepID=A0A183CXC8_9BILA|nr:unnamed protein product [Gongylonema pulchrum]